MSFRRSYPLKKGEILSSFFHLLRNMFFLFLHKILQWTISPKFCRMRVGQHLLKWDCQASPEARSHFCAAEPGKVWHLLVITRHIFKLWKCGLGAQPGMNMIGEEDYKTRNARLFLFWPGFWFAMFLFWLNLYCPFEYHKLKSRQWHIW